MGPNMLIARLATKKAKPNGQHLITDSQVVKFIANEKVSDLPGK